MSKPSIEYGHSVDFRKIDTIRQARNLPTTEKVANYTAAYIVKYCTNIFKN